MDMELKKIIDVLLNDEEKEFALTPFNPKPKKKMKDLFSLFENAEKTLLYCELFRKIDECKFENISNALDTVKFYKGDYNEFNSSISFKTYVKIEKWISIETNLLYKKYFFRQYGNSLLNDDIQYLDIEVLETIMKEDLDLYIKIAKKMNITNAIHDIFSIEPKKIYYWVNEHDRKYEELKKLNNPEFVLKNMNGELDVSTETLRYILEHSAADINLYKSVKSRLGFTSLYELTHENWDDNFYTELVETIDDLHFVMNIGDLKIGIIDLILKKIKSNYPNLYENLNTIIMSKNKTVINK